MYERGRRGVIYFDCEPTSLAYVQRYFSTAGRWLSHQLGDHLQLGCVSSATYRDNSVSCIAVLQDRLQSFTLAVHSVLDPALMGWTYWCNVTGTRPP